MTENQLGLVLAKEEFELIWNLENDWYREIPRESEKKTSDIENKEKSPSPNVMYPILFTSPRVKERESLPLHFKRKLAPRMRRWTDRIFCYRMEKSWIFTVKQRKGKRSLIFEVVQTKKKRTFVLPVCKI